MILSGKQVLKIGTMKNWNSVAPSASSVYYVADALASTVDKLIFDEKLISEQIRKLAFEISQLHQVQIDAICCMIKNVNVRNRKAVHDRTAFLLSNDNSCNVVVQTFIAKIKIT